MTYEKMLSIQILIADWVKGHQSLMSPVYCFVLFYKIQISPFNSFMLRATPFALQLYYSYILFVFFWTCFLLCLSALSHIAFFLFCFFSSIMIFCSVKAPRKAVLFHEYQASTGRFNKFVSLLAAALSFFMNAVSQRVCLSASLSLITGHPGLKNMHHCIVRVVPKLPPLCVCVCALCVWS